MKCKFCGGKHNPEIHPYYKIADQLFDAGFPTHAKDYEKAHKQANKMENKEFGAKAFNELKHIAAKMHKDELEGKNTKSGKVEVSRKIPKKLREEVAYHEEVENKILRRKK